MTRNREFFPGVGNTCIPGLGGIVPKTAASAWSGTLKNLEHRVKQNGGSLRLGKDTLPDHQPN